MKCPVCGKELAEKVSFCIYCMTPLDEKREATPRFFHKKRWLVLLALCLAVAVALPIVLVAVPNGASEKNQTEPSATRRVNTVPICTPFGFQDLALYTYDKCANWDPFSGYLLKADGRSELYLHPVYLEGASLKLLFEDDGCRIRGELTDVAPKDLDAAITVMHELMDMLCTPAKMDPASVRFTGEVGSSEAVLSPQKYGYPEIYAYTELKQEGETYTLILELS